MNRTHRRPLRRLPAKLVWLALLLIGVLAFWTLGGGERSEADAGPSLIERAQGAFSLEPRDTQAATLVDFPYAIMALPVAEVTDTQYLKLVNREHALQNALGEADLVNVWPDLPARTSYVTLRETAQRAMVELFAAAGRADVRGLFIASGFRSFEEQRELYQNAADRSYILPPGHSEHQLGLAADILASDHTDGMANTPEARWLAQNAPQFGLILRYPYEKQEVTGVAYEPWHFRYVGRVHAWIMGRYDFVLEEYIAFLQEQALYQTSFDGRTYYILYQRPQNGMISVPEELEFNVSTANTGGFIVTAWR